MKAMMFICALCSLRMKEHNKLTILTFAHSLIGSKNHFQNNIMACDYLKFDLYAMVNPKNLDDVLLALEEVNNELENLNETLDRVIESLDGLMGD